MPFAIAPIPNNITKNTSNTVNIRTSFAICTLSDKGLVSGGQQNTPDSGSVKNRATSNLIGWRLTARQGKRISGSRSFTDLHVLLSLISAEMSRSLVRISSSTA